MIPGLLFAAPAGTHRFPLKSAIRTLEGPVGIVIRGMAGAGIGFGKGQFIMEVGVVMTKSSAAYGTGSPGLLFTKPTFHCCNLRCFFDRFSLQRPSTFRARYVGYSTV